jgi:phytoene dehydrogenase-like protein
MTKRTVIVGSGHNGLVTAFYLARAGLRPLVLERRPVVGGAATTEEIAAGVRGPSMAHTLGPLRPSIVRDMKLIERGLRFIEPDPTAVALAPDGRHVAFFRDHARTQQSLSTFSKRDAGRYPEFAGTMARLAGVLSEALEMTPPDVDHPERRDLWKLLSAGRRFRALPKQDAFRLLRWMPMAVADLVGEFFENDLVQATIAARALYGTNLGPWSAATGALLLLHAASDPLPAGTSVTAAGGPGAVTNAMAAAATEAGAEIRTSASVSRIEVGRLGVEAVVLESGETVAASAVISNADPRRTFLGLLDPTVLEPGFVNRITNYRSRGTTAKLNLVLSAAPSFAGLGADPALLGARIHIGPGIDYLEQAFDASKYGRFSEHPWLDVRVPTASDSGLATDGRHLLSIVAHFTPRTLRQGDWVVGRNDFASTVFRKLDEYAPGLSSSIVAQQIFTPKDIEQRCAMTGGHIHHGEPGLDQLFVMRPVMGWARYRTPIKGLYLCGAGTHPGLGLTGGSGQNAAREILRELMS